MPVKKTTRKAPAKKTPVKKTTAAKKSTPTTVSKTAKPVASSCGALNNNMVATVLLILNTVLLLLLVTYFSPKKAFEQMEAQRVGWQENYELIQEIYELDTFKQQQRFQIEQTLQALQGNMEQQMPNLEELDPEAELQAE